MKRLNLAFNFENKKVYNRDGKNLSKTLMMRGCKTTNLEPFAFLCSTPEKCVVTKVLTRKTKMLMYLFTADEKGNLFFFIIEFNDTDKNGKN